MQSLMEVYIRSKEKAREKFTPKAKRKNRTVTIHSPMSE